MCTTIEERGRAVDTRSCQHHVSTWSRLTSRIGARTTLIAITCPVSSNDLPHRLPSLRTAISIAREIEVSNWIPLDLEGQDIQTHLLRYVDSLVLSDKTFVTNPRVARKTSANPRPCLVLTIAKIYYFKHQEPEVLQRGNRGID